VSGAQYGHWHARLDKAVAGWGGMNWTRWGPWLGHVGLSCVTRMIVSSLLPIELPGKNKSRISAGFFEFERSGSARRPGHRRGLLKPAAEANSPRPHAACWRPGKACGTGLQGPCGREADADPAGVFGPADAIRAQRSCRAVSGIFFIGGGGNHDVLRAHSARQAPQVVKNSGSRSRSCGSVTMHAGRPKSD